jgi:EpsI family protein
MGNQPPTNPSSRLPGVVGLLLAGGLVAAYANAFGEMWIRWFPAWRHAGQSLYDRLVGGESYYTHGPLVPVISLIMMVLLVRHTRIPLEPKRIVGTVVLAGSLLVHLVACFARVNFVSGFSLIGALAGLVLLLWGATALRRLWFPLVLLAFMVPLPEVMIANLNLWLKMRAADIGVWGASGLGIIVERSRDRPNEVLLQDGKMLVIANVCNGLRTIVSLLAFGAIYAYVSRLRGLWRLGLFAMSVPVAVVSNSIRIVSLIVVADIWDEKTATGWYHDLSGLLIYVLAFSLMFAIERLVLALRRMAGRPAVVLPLFHGVLRDPEDEGQWGRLARAVGSRAGWTAAFIVLAAAGVTWMVNTRVANTWNQAMAAKSMPRTIEVDGRRLYGFDLALDDNTLTILETTDYLYRRYEGAGAPAVSFCVIFSQDNRKGTHPPEVCLGESVVASRSVVVRNVAGQGDVPCRMLLTATDRRRECFLYVYKCGREYTASFWKQQLIILVNGLLHRNASGALIRVSTAVVDNDEEAARKRCAAMMAAAIPYLDAALP